MTDNTDSAFIFGLKRAALTLRRMPRFTREPKTDPSTEPENLNRTDKVWPSMATDSEYPKDKKLTSTKDGHAASTLSSTRIASKFRNTTKMSRYRCGCNLCMPVLIGYDKLKYWELLDANEEWSFPESSKGGSSSSRLP